MLQKLQKWEIKDYSVDFQDFFVKSILERFESQKLPSLIMFAYSYN